MNLIHAIILAIIEGITEFLPVSSTGHMVIGSTFMGIASEPFVKMFTVAIQFGAILSVIVQYWRRFFQSFDFYIKLFIAFIPAAVFGLLLKDHIDAMLENIVVVAFSLIVGGIILLFIDDYFAKNERETDSGIEEVNYVKAFFIGCFQVISMVPGVSRSASTIIGGLTQGLTRKTAAEFSFFLAVPTMFAATAKSLFDYLKDGGTFTQYEITLLLIGNVVAFLVAWLAIRSFIAFLTKNGFRVFGIYRIVVGLLIMGLWAMGYFENLSLSNF